MEITIWGTRGSVPVASAETTKYGGNTTCIEVTTDAGDCIILDAGTGIRALGEVLSSSKDKKCTICLTHAHWDHLQGLPFFGPIYSPNWEVTVCAARTEAQTNVKKTLQQVFNGKNFPIELDNAVCKFNFMDFEAGIRFKVGSAVIETCATRHHGGGTAYKISADGWTFLFTGDHEACIEGEQDPQCSALEEFIKGTDVLLADGQYTASEYPNYRGWGHSCQEAWPDLAARCGVKQLLFTHHDPTRIDDTLSALQESLEKRYEYLPVAIEMAYEGMHIAGIHEGMRPMPRLQSLSRWLSNFGEDISRYSDIGMILDRLLSEARACTTADAGTIYMVEGDELVFAYTQNDTLFPGSAANKHIYQNARLPITTKSIAGYAATNQCSLKIDNVRKIPKAAPYVFNDNFDKTTGYTTVSVLAVPFVLKDRLIAVLQLINHKNAEDVVTPFRIEDEVRISLLSGIAVSALERGTMANELILRMLQLTALRDPSETNWHVRRVGAMAAELYHRWAEKHDIAPQELRYIKDHLRLAAMLHDIGKVGIPDAILKKKGSLDPDERTYMEQHTWLGAKIFDNTSWEVDKMAREVALHHHQKWDGSGYTGNPNETVLTGADIPLSARITAVADVYDALVSKRCYKEPLSQEEALAILKKDAGKHFDPEVIEAFLEITDIIAAISARFPDQ